MITKSYNINMTTKGLIILLTCIGVFLIGVIFFVLTGIFHVKKGHAIIIEKVKMYHGTYQEGWYWFWPFLYQRVGYYNLNPTKNITLKNGRHAEIKYRIFDLKLYHYSKITVEAFINKITLEQVVVNLEFLKSNLKQIGVELITIRPID